MRNNILHTFWVIVMQIFICFQLTSATTYYVDSQLGNDGNNGKLPSTAWKTIDKVNVASLVGGDNVLFKRGEVFRGTLIPKSGYSTISLTYGAYGDEASPKPKLLASYQRNSQSDWRNESANIWSSGDKLSSIPSESFGGDVGNIIFGNEAACGVKVWNKEDLNEEGEFWFDTTSSRVFLYTTHGNPAIYYQNLELATTKQNISTTAKSYIIIQDLDLRYGGGGGIYFTGYKSGSNIYYPNNIVIRNVDISFIGGAKLSGTTRAGNGIQFWNGARDVIIERCRISQIYDSGISPQGDLDGHTCQNFYFRNNIIDKCEQSFEMWQRGISNLSNVYFENNTCTNAGFGWSHNQRPDPNGVHVLLWGFASTVSISNIQIRNNVFLNVKDYGIYSHWAGDINKVNIDYNCWYPQSSTTLLRFSYPLNSTVKSPMSYTWSAYRSAFSDDAHSILANPLINPDGSLTSNSPCKDIGLTISTVTNDFYNLARLQGTGYDIGAFEYAIVNDIETITTNNLAVTVYPNPATEYISVRFDRSPTIPVQLLLISLNGKVIENETIYSTDAGVFRLNFSRKHNTGYYLLKVIGDEFSKTIPVAIL